MPSAQKNKPNTRIRSKEFNWNEAMEMAENMQHLSTVLQPMQKEADRRQRKLKKFPKGFHLEGKGYTCALCRDSCSEEYTWYDQYGVKCMQCQACIDRGDIPAYCAEDRDKWYCRWDMESDFNVNRHTLRRWMKEGILKGRTIERERRETTLLFLIEDNKGFLPPKELVKSQSVTIQRKDGSTAMTMAPWYKFVDPKEHLKDYKIMDHLQFVDGKLEPIPKKK